MLLYFSLFQFFFSCPLHIFYRFRILHCFRFLNGFEFLASVRYFFFSFTEHKFEIKNMATNNSFFFLFCIAFYSSLQSLRIVWWVSLGDILYSYTNCERHPLPFRPFITVRFSSSVLKIKLNVFFSSLSTHSFKCCAIRWWWMQTRFYLIFWVRLCSSIYVYRSNVIYLSRSNISITHHGMSANSTDKISGKMWNVNSLQPFMVHPFRKMIIWRLKAY